MKLNKILLAVLLSGLLFSCENSDITFDDFEYTSVYFANQYPMRILELGEDPQVDNSLDNEYKFRVMATMGGVYANTQDRIINIEVDNSLCDGVSFDIGSSDLLPLPENYYNLASDQIVINAGNIMGGVEVELTDAFFADPSSIGQYYVLPVVMTDVTNADTILSGRPAQDIENPRKLVSDDWEVAPKDYVLYGIKYVNPWHANYLRRGVDEISDGTNSVTDVRHEEYVEYDEVVSTATVSLTECSLPITIYAENGTSTRANIELLLTFDDDNNCIVSGSSSSYSISGTGQFVIDGERNSMGGTDRNALYLDYNVELLDLGYTYSTKDTLVCRDRGITPEYYTIVVE